MRKTSSNPGVTVGVVALRPPDNFNRHGTGAPEPCAVSIMITPPIAELRGLGVGRVSIGSGAMRASSLIAAGS